MRSAQFLIAAVIAMVCVGCTNPTKPDGYAAYLQMVDAQAKRADAQLAGITAAAQSCTDSRCVEHVAALAALATATGGGHATQAAPPPREQSGWETFAHVASALSPLAGNLVNGAVQWHQADASRDVSIAQYGAIDHIVTGAVTGMGQVASSAVPSITVGGDYVSGTQVGRDYITGNPVTTTVGHDQVGGNQYQGPVAGGDQRWSSPGPVGDGCLGDGCQPLNVP